MFFGHGKTWRKPRRIPGYIDREELDEMSREADQALRRIDAMINAAELSLFEQFCFKIGRLLCQLPLPR